jgi:hypothetical protein
VPVPVVVAAPWHRVETLQQHLTFLAVIARGEIEDDLQRALRLRSMEALMEDVALLLRRRFAKQRPFRDALISAARGPTLISSVRAAAASDAVTTSAFHRHWRAAVGARGTTLADFLDCLLLARLIVHPTERRLNGIGHDRGCRIARRHVGMTLAAARDEHWILTLQVLREKMLGALASGARRI